MAVRTKEEVKEPEIDVSLFEKITIPYRKIICKSCNNLFESSLVVLREIPDESERCFFKCETCGVVNKIKRVRSF